MLKLCLHTPFIKALIIFFRDSKMPIYISLYAFMDPQNDHFKSSLSDIRIRERDATFVVTSIVRGMPPPLLSLGVFTPRNLDIQPRSCRQVIR